MTPKEQALKMIESRIEAIQNLSIECIDYIFLAAHNEALELAARTFELKDYKLNEIVSTIRSLKVESTDQIGLKK